MTYIPPTGGTDYGNFGDGSDGAKTYNGGGTTTLAADLYATSITVTNNTILDPGGFRIFCTGTIQVDSGSSIKVDGKNGFDGPTGSGGAIPFSAGTLEESTAGGTGRVGVGDSTAAMNATALKFGGAGGNGGSGPGGSGGTATDQSAPATQAAIGNPIGLLMGQAYGRSGGSAEARYVAGGIGGGGGGGGGATGIGGGGGSGGGAMIIIAKAVINNGTISANGGNGGNGEPAKNAGGGGGGGGGFVGIFCTSYSGSDPTATAGTGGTGTGTGNNGSNGSAGTVSKLVTA